VIVNEEGRGRENDSSAGRLNVERRVLGMDAHRDLIWGMSRAEEEKNCNSNCVSTSDKFMPSRTSAPTRSLLARLQESILEL